MASEVESLHRFLSRRESEDRERWHTVRRRLDRAAGRLVRQFPTITFVAVIGSFLTPPLFRADSDVDIVARGLRGEDYFDALFLLEQELQIPVDLLREEETPESLRFRLRSALVLYAS